MADDRLLAAVRRYWTPEQMDAAYRAIFAAYYDRQQAAVEIIGVSFEGESSSGTVTIQREDYLEWMDALEALLKEAADTTTGTKPAPEGAPIANYGGKYLDP